MNQNNRSLVKGKIIVETDKVKICPKCRKLLPADNNYCWDCPGVPLMEVEFQ